MKTLRRTLLWFGLLALFFAGCSFRQDPATPPPAPAAQAAPEAAPPPTGYACKGGDAVNVTYVAQGARVVHGGKEFVMQPMESASGAAYTDGKLIWHTKGDEGMLREVDSDRVLASACRTTGGAQPAAPAGALPAEVVDVTWQWAGMTTPIEQITVASPERYTLRFESSGRLSLQADCNRGGGSYTVAADRKITLGPLALTRMMCPPGSQSDRFVKELGRVSSYFTKDGELFLELPVDSGTLRFTRQP
jgi:heat shock protein HslJ